ncbi:GNAT family N-acetyltransferase [Fibrisoma montanum]|uniref:GNAT family N-acetyltransferase n=1 Tax=Fibrisoma montanum TaxID=2305895 RepID=A0A418MCG0_9BACT|nr:GNAT family N-acetyltransferase [Fibrisoma montanum]RIV24057.1 GNAT family N-acetyltransferase [Fibrisoma montanum]
MPEPATLFPRPITLPDGEVLTIRLLQPTDAATLYNYLSGLSEQSKSYFGPHPFDEATAQLICDTLDPTHTLRLIASRQTGDVVAYMLLLLGVLPDDLARLQAVKYPIQLDKAGTVAPSVADVYQSRKLGSLMLEHLLETGRSLGKSQVVLWGGVQKRNQKAVNFYTKFGFMPVGSFWRGDIDNYDMVLTLDDLPHR